MDQKQLKNKLKGRTPEQKKVIEYFYGAGGGCLSSGLKDANYDALIMDKIISTDWKQKALNKIGIDQTQVNEIEPVFFHYYVFDPALYLKLGKDKKWRSSRYQLSYIFFSSVQIYVYQYTFNLDSDEKTERTEEYFYKDITNFSSLTNTIESEFHQKNNCGGSRVYSRTKVDRNEFAIIVPGDKFSCAIDENKNAEQIIQGMKAKLREKKA